MLAEIAVREGNQKIDQKLDNMNEGDWIEGAPQWWWRYVLPAQEEFWRLIAYGGPDTDPSPVPWKQASISLLEAVALVRGIGRTAEREAKTRLHQEAIQKVQNASKALEAAKL